MAVPSQSPRTDVAARGPRRPWLVAAALYLVLAVVMMGQGLRPGWTTSSADYLWSSTPWASSAPSGVGGLGSNFELEDIPIQHEPFWRYTRETFPRAQLWNPYIAAGRPFLGNGQAAPYSPFLLPVNAPVLPFTKGLVVAEILKLWIAALAMFAFARCTLAMRFGGALVAGLVYAFAVYMVVWLPYPLTNVFPLIPLALLLAERLARRPGPLPAAGLAATFGVQLLGGHPESCFHLSVVLVGFFGLVALLHRRRERRPWRSLVPRTAWFAGALVLGAGLAAIALVPFLELLRHSSDLGNRVATNPGHLDPRFLGALFLNDYWGRATQDATITPFLQNRGFYAGALTLVLAATAVIGRPRSAARIAVVVLAVACMTIALGLPPLFDIVTALPGFSTTHNSRLALYVLLALALLAGWGFDDLAGGRLDARRRRLVVGAAVAIFCVPLVWLGATRTVLPLHPWAAFKVAWLFHDMPAVGAFNVHEATAGPVIRLSALLEWLPLAAAAVALVVLRLRGRLAPPAFLVAAVALLAIDLLRAGMGFNPAIPVDHARQPVTPAIRRLQAERPGRFVGMDSNPVSQTMPPDVAMDYRLYDARSYDYPSESRYDTLWRHRVAEGLTSLVPASTTALPRPSAVRALGLLSVTHVMQGPDGPPLRLPGLHIQYHGRDARIYTNEHALPRTFVVGRQAPLAGGTAQLDAVTAPGFDGRRVAVTERPLAGVPTGPAGGATPAGSSRLVRYDTDRITIRATARRRALVVLTDTWFPGWKAEVDGHAAPIERVDYLLRGVSVGPGAHTITMRYAPVSFRVGWIVSLVSLLVLAGLLALGLRARRRG